MSINKPEGDFNFTFPAPPGILFSEPIEVSYSEEDNRWGYWGVKFRVKGAMGSRFSPTGDTSVNVSHEDFWNTEETDIQKFLAEYIAGKIANGEN